MTILSRRLRGAGLAAAVVLAATAISVVPAQGAPPPTATGDLAPSHDFNGDGYGDLAVGVPGESHSGAGQAGAVNVIYGSGNRLTPVGNELWSQASRGVAGHPERGDGFGGAIAGADFNGDGRDDLAVGVSGEGLGRASLAGAVHVLYGSRSGLTAVGDQFWSQASRGVPGAAEQGDEFGGSLVTGNFNGDRYADLAVGSPKETVGSVVAAGSVTVLYGSASGLRAAGSTAWTQASGGVDQPGTNNLFGEALAAGDVNRDGFADLAVGAPSRTYGEDKRGEVLLFFGSAQGLAAVGAQAWSQDSADIADAPEPDDQFGAALSFGDADGDGYADLVVGVPGEGFGQCSEVDEGQTITRPCTHQGAAHVLLGGARGLTARGSSFWHKDGGGLPGTAREGDTLGSAVVAGDFDGDGRWAVALHSDDADTARGAGAVYVMSAIESRGRARASVEVWTQDSPGVRGASETGDNFGDDLAVGNFAGGTRHALVAAVPQEQLGRHPSAGWVVVIYGSPNGLTGTGSEAWAQSSRGIRGGSETGDRFGSVDGEGRSTG